MAVKKKCDIGLPNFKHSCDAWPEYSTVAMVECTLHYLENSIVKTNPLIDPCNNISHTTDAIFTI